MGEIKDKLETFGSLLIEDLQKATVCSNVDDIFAARLFTQKKIQELVESKPATFSERVELKQMRMIDGLLEKRYNQVKKRKDQQQKKHNNLKKQRSELHKLIDSDLVYTLIRQNAKNSVLLEKEKMKNEVIEAKHMSLVDKESSELLERVNNLAREKNVPIEEAIRLLGKEAKEISNDAINVLIKNSENSGSEALNQVDFSVMTENEPLTKLNPLDLDKILKEASKTSDDPSLEYQGKDELIKEKEVENVAKSA